MGQPKWASDDLYEQLMLRCWAEAPEDRPSFADIVVRLQPQVESNEKFFKVRVLLLNFGFRIIFIRLTVPFAVATKSTVPREKVTRHGFTRHCKELVPETRVASRASFPAIRTTLQ